MVSRNENYFLLIPVYIRLAAYCSFKLQQRVVSLALKLEVAYNYARFDSLDRRQVESIIAAAKG